MIKKLSLLFISVQLLLNASILDEKIQRVLLEIANLPKTED